MASNFTVRFYEMSKGKHNGLSFRQALEIVDKITPRAGRLKNLVAGYDVRLERYDLDGDELTGEFTRVDRLDDFPVDVIDDAVQALNPEGDIGMGVAFRYRPADHTLAIQYNTQAVSPQRMIEYLKKFNNSASFKIEPKLDEENWRRFLSADVRRFQFKIASPDKLSDIEDEDVAVSSSLKALGEAYSAPVITVELGMGHQKGSLSEDIKRVASTIKSMISAGVDVKALKARVKPGDSGAVEEINLINEILSTKIELILPKNNPQEHYDARQDFLKKALSEH